MEDNTLVWLLFAGPEHMREMPSRACRRHANSLLWQSPPLLEDIALFFHDRWPSSARHHDANRHPPHARCNERCMRRFSRWNAAA